MLSVGYGVVYDFVFERFGPYRNLKTEVLSLIEKVQGFRAGRALAWIGRMPSSRRSMRLQVEAISSAWRSSR